MDRRQVIQRVKQFADIVRRDLPDCEVLLYGSHARGRGRADSDIDVAVVVDEYAGDLLGMKARLFRLRRGVDLRIEPLLLERKHDPAGFLGEILRTGRAIV